MQISARSRNSQPILVQRGFAQNEALQKSSEMQNGEPGGSPFCYFCFVACGAGAMLLIMIGQFSRATRTACAV
jgi:hypothetical protein